MTQAKQRFRTIEQYAALDPSDLPEGNYELVDGVIVEMGAERDQNLEIVALLFSVLPQFIPYQFNLFQSSQLKIKLPKLLPFKYYGRFSNFQIL